MKTTPCITTYMARAAMMLLVALSFTTEMKAQTPYAIFCEANKTFYFTNRDEALTEGDTFTPEGTSDQLTITALWSGTDVSASSRDPEWYLNSIIKENTVTVVFEPSFADVSPASTESWFNSFQALETVQGLEYMGTSIDNYAFQGCSGLISLTIPNSVTSIGQAAIYGCSSLTSLSIPNSVTSIGVNAFFGCSASLTSISVDEGNPNYDSRNNSNAIIETSSNTLIVGCKNTIIPNSVTSIGDYAFHECSNLTSLTIPNSVTSIGSFAFEGCSGLTDVTIPSSVTTIGMDAFKGTAWLNNQNGVVYINKIAHTYSGEMPEGTTVTLIEGTLAVGDYAFYDCKNLKTVIIPNSVTSIGESAFDGCSGLTSLSIPNSVTSIGNNAFERCSSLTSVTIPSSVTSIGNNAFIWCLGLTSVTIRSGEIGNDAFYNCKNLTTLNIDSGVTSIGNNTFRNCSSLTSVTIPNSVTSIGSGAFQNCSGLTSVTIPNSVTSIGNSAFWGCSGLTSVTIPNSVTSIGNNTFRNCSSLTSVTIPNSVTSIGDYAFQDCSALTSVTIGSGVTSIGQDAFKNTAWLNNQNGLVYISKIAYTYHGEMPEGTTITLNDGTIAVYQDAFRGCQNLKTIIIPNSVTSIGKNAFSNCSNLTTLTIGSGVKSIGESAFSYCSNLTTLNIPNSVASIGNNAFQNCSGLTSLTIPNSVASIGNNAFQNCSGLTSLTIRSGEIGNGAFYYCKNLTSLTIGSGVTSIGEDAFSNCSNLTSLTIGRGVKSIENSAFYNCRKLSDIYCYADTLGFSWEGGGSGDFKENNATLFHVFDERAWSSKFGTYNVTFVGDLTIRLEDKADNTDLIASFINQEKSATLVDRILYKDRSWTTLCLPFNLSSLTGTPLEGFTVKELDIETPYEGHKTGFSEGTLYLNFKDADGIVAGMPYIVKKKDVEALIINSEEDWNTFAQNVSSGTTYEGKIVSLGDDISVSTMVNGNFRGTFDGNGHTINVNLNGGGEGLSLFYIIENATIQNVRVTGTVTSTSNRPATFTSFVKGNSTIKNC